MWKPPLAGTARPQAAAPGGVDFVGAVYRERPTQAIYPAFRQRDCTALAQALA